MVESHSRGSTSGLMACVLDYRELIINWKAQLPNSWCSFVRLTISRLVYELTITFDGVCLSNQQPSAAHLAPTPHPKPERTSQRQNLVAQSREQHPSARNTGLMKCRSPRLLPHHSTANLDVGQFSPHVNAYKQYVRFFRATFPS